MGFSYYNCSKCDTPVREDEVVWATDTGKLTTMNIRSKPWCDACLPPEKVDKMQGKCRKCFALTEERPCVSCGSTEVRLISNGAWEDYTLVEELRGIGVRYLVDDISEEYNEKLDQVVEMVDALHKEDVAE
jgi:hypothetical protein